MTSSGRPLACAVLALGVTLTATGMADIVTLHARTVSRSGAPMNPAIAVAFNPQPEPPGTPFRVDLRDPSRPVFTASSTSGGSYSFGMGINAGERNTVRLFPPGPCFPPDPYLPPGPCRTSMYGVAADGTRFQIALEISSSSGPVDRTSWVAFNPQPDPPGFPGAVTINFALSTRETATSTSITAQIINLDNDRALELY